MEITPFRRHLTGPFPGLQEIAREFQGHPVLSGFPFGEGWQLLGPTGGCGRSRGDGGGAD